MPKRTNDPLRIKVGDDRLNQAQEAAAFLAEKRGVRGAAGLLDWSMADISRIANGKWTEIKMYPETVEALLLAYSVVANDVALIDPIKSELAEFSREVGAVVRRAARIRKMIKRVNR